MKPNEKHLPLWPIPVLIIIIILLAMLNPLCRYFYTKDFVARSDIQTAHMLADQLQDAGITDISKPIYFIGSGTTRTNASCLDLSNGKYDIFSVFAAADALNLSPLESSRYIVTYLNDLGYGYTLPDTKHFAAYESEITAVLPLPKSFPWYDSVLETEHCIIVQLSPENPENA